MYGLRRRRILAIGVGVLSTCKRLLLLTLKLLKLVLIPIIVVLKVSRMFLSLSLMLGLALMGLIIMSVGAIGFEAVAGFGQLNTQLINDLTALLW